jgi:dienelactone hydrolase
MDLLGLPFLLVLVALAVALMIGVGWLWMRWPSRPPGLRLAGRGVSLMLVMVMGAVIAGDLVNRSYGFYSSFADLFGQSLTSADPVNSFAVPGQHSGLEILTPNWLERGRRAAATNAGVVLEVRYSGPASGVRRAGLLYVPAAYFTNPRHPLPGLEIFHGYPGSPRNVQQGLRIGPILDREISAGRIPPVVAAIPATYEGRSTECTDAGRQKNETFLAVDVPADLQTVLPVLPGRSFAALGYSSGGFCAANLALHHPDRYVAAGIMSGYFTAGEDPGTGHLYGRGTTSRQFNSPIWWVTHRRPAAPALYLTASKEDPGSASADVAMATALRRHDPRLPMATTLLPAGGHNFNTWTAMLGPTLDWIARFLPAPLAAPLTLPAAPIS